MKYSVQELSEGIRKGQLRFLAKGITLIESKRPEDRAKASELLELLMPFSGNSVRIGITGIPGAGKSTFIENFGLMAIAEGKKVAVLAIDPSSAVNKGSILGDKTRMEELAKSENAFIRPSPSSGFLGGIANTTFETMILCEAAGYDLILIETVGVGQSEVLVSEITDVFLFLKITGGGDELQGIKRGIMEMVDIVFINKVNDENRVKAKSTKQELLRALHFMTPKEENWKIPVHLGSALNKTGLDEVMKSALNFVDLKKQAGRFEEIRKNQARKRFQYWVQEYILQNLKQDEKMNETYNFHQEQVSNLKSNPSSEAQKFVEKFLNNSNVSPQN